jgi:D-amino-acid oxidase
LVNSTDVLVVGAGVAGLTTAVCLAERGHRVRVLAAEPPGRTTSAVAGAVTAGPAFSDPAEGPGRWQPFDAAVRWHRESLAEFATLAADPDSGVRVARGRMVTRQPVNDGPWLRALPGFTACTPEEHAGFPVAFWMTVPIVDMPRYLDYLAGRLAAAGGDLTVGRLDSPDGAAADVVVNCTGAGAREFAGDPSVFPIRGQHVVVENPGLSEFLFEFNPSPASTSFIPHGRRLVLGGVAEKDSWNTRPDPRQTEEILRRCAEVEPRIAGCDVLGVEVGLRVGRPRIRVEEELVGGTRVVHNYGHGPVAVSMSWGCAREAARAVTRAVTV